MSISLCLIVKNEEKSLANCLNSFKGLVDEIVIADTGSTDKTKKIAKDFGAIVFDYKWKDDFSDARNFVLSKAKNDWIMIADADDILPEKSSKIIKRYLKSVQKSIQVISLPYVYNQAQGTAGNTAWLPKIWKKSAKLKYIYPIHEYLDVSKTPRVNIKQLDAPVIHAKESHEYKAGFKRNVGIMNKYIKKNPNDLRILYYLIHDNRHLGEFKTAIKWCEKYIETNPSNAIKLNKVYMLQSMCYLNLKEQLLAKYSFLAAIGANPLLIEPYLQLGDYFFRKKKYNEAVQMYKNAKNCEIPKMGGLFFNRAAYDYFADRKLAYILPHLNRNEEALFYAKKVLKHTPDDKKLKDFIKNLKKNV